jgi:N-acetylmuramoyl-L-alanine amidase
LKYRVKKGDCIESIALSYGFFPGTLWSLPDNAELKKLRCDGNFLEVGDSVIVPKLRQKAAACESHKKHTFKRKGVPSKLLVVFNWPATEQGDVDCENDASTAMTNQSDSKITPPSPMLAKPIANAPYLINIDAQLSEGKSDTAGLVELSISPSAKRVMIRFYPNTQEELVFTLNLGEMKPVDTIEGVRQRLINLGYACEAQGEELSDDLQAALTNFHQDNKMETNNRIEQDTIDKLKALHGS